MSNASLTAAHGRTRISLDCKFRRVSSISLGKYLFNKEEIHFRAPIAYRPPLFHIRREKERERGWLHRRMFFGHWEYTDDFKAEGFSFAVINHWWLLPTISFSPFYRHASWTIRKSTKESTEKKGSKRRERLRSRNRSTSRTGGYSNALNSGRWGKLETIPGNIGTYGLWRKVKICRFLFLKWRRESKKKRTHEEGMFVPRDEPTSEKHYALFMSSLSARPRELFLGSMYFDGEK